MKQFLLFCAATMLLLSSGCFSNNANPNLAIETIRIGVVLPLSGENQIYGERSLAGMQLAVDEANRRNMLDGRKVELFIADNKGDGDKTVTVMENLIFREKAVAIIGAYTTMEALRMKDVAERTGTPTVIPQATNDEIVNNTRFVFQSCFTDSIQARGLAYFMRFKLRLLQIGVMLNTDVAATYSRDLGRRTGQNFVDFGGRVATMCSYKESDTDFSRQIREMMGVGVEAIVMPSYPATALRFIKQARELGFDGVIIGPDSYDAAALYESPELELGECFYSTGYAPAAAKSEYAQKFVDSIRERTGREPGNSEALGFDGMVMLLKGFRGALDPGMAAENLRNLKSFPSVTGEVVKGSDKKIIRPVIIIKRQKNGPKLADVIEVNRINRE